MIRAPLFKHILVLGGSGFIGRTLLQEISKYENNITCLIHEKPLPTHLMESNAKLEVIDGSITNFNWRTLDNDPPDMIFHLARIPGRRSLGRRISSRKSSKASSRLFEWIQLAETKPKIAYVSGSLTYGSNAGITTEKAPLNPTSYASQYIKGELPIYNAYKQLKEAPILIFKPGWVYGKGSWFEEFFAKPMQLENNIPLYGDGNNWMSFIHVLDCSRMIFWISTQASRGIYNLFSGKPLKQHDFVKLLSELTGLPIRKRSIIKIRLKYGKAVKEAFDFTLKLGTIHKALYRKYDMKYEYLKDGLLEVLAHYDLI